MKTVGALGERGLIRLLRDLLPGLSMIGDDCAVLPAIESPVVTTDSFMEGSHFHRWWAPPEVLGRRFLEAALSDLAAMGAKAGWVFAALHLPPEMPVRWLVGFYEGLLHRAEVPVAGGETVRSGTLGLTLTAIGEGGDPGTLMRRSTLSSGDRLWVTGPIGRALNAPKLLERAEGVTGSDLVPVLEVLSTPELHQVRAFLTPEAALVRGEYLRTAGIRCAIDISDGLLSEAEHLAAESGVDVIIDLEAVPLFASVEKTPLEAASAGEDFELLFAAPAGWEPGFPGCAPVGRAGDPGGGLKVRMDGKKIEPNRTGYDHMEVGE